MKTIEDFAMLEPMKYYNNETECPKRRDMLNNKDNLYMGTEKHDGDWAMFIHWSQGHNLIRSRSISKVTEVYGDYTKKVPHLVAEMDSWPDNTVVLAELCWDKYGTNANTVGTILRCLPPKAVERQKEEKLVGYIFDVLMVDGVDQTERPYIERYAWVDEGFMSEVGRPSPLLGTYFKATQVFWDDFEAHATEIINAGGEGLVIQKKSNPYMPGTRTAWATLKLKQKLDSAEYLVIGTLNPNENYEGDCPDTWKYWAVGHFEGDEIVEEFVETEGGRPYLNEREVGCRPVTKPCFMGWKNGITIMLPSGIECDVTSGLTDEDREWLATGEATKAIALHEIYAEVAAMSINDKGALRHPYVVRLRSIESGANQ